MGRAASELGIKLIGGDTTRNSQISITLTVIGEVGRGLAVTRSGARPGDAICVSGRLGRAALGLALMESRVRASRALSRLLKRTSTPKLGFSWGLGSRDIAWPRP